MNFSRETVSANSGQNERHKRPYSQIPFLRLCVTGHPRPQFEMARKKFTYPLEIAGVLDLRLRPSALL